jgi:hypothetical protein
LYRSFILCRTLEASRGAQQARIQFEPLSPSVCAGLFALLVAFRRIRKQGMIDDPGEWFCHAVVLGRRLGEGSAGLGAEQQITPAKDRPIS